MENVCHTLAGFALARGGLADGTPLATTALVVGANLPDVDLVWSSFRSALVYDHYHRGWTHSIPGSLGLALVWWLFLLAANRWLAARGTARRARPGPLLLAAATGVGSHVLMDAANSYGIRPFLPWSDRWVYGDLWVIVDPWLWLFLGGAVYLSAAGGWRRDAIWLMAAAAAAIVVLSAPVVPASCRAAWAAGLAITLSVCRKGALRPGPAAARAGLGLVVVYAGLCAVSHHAALGRIERLAAAGPAGTERKVAALPHPADPLRWEGIIADASTLRYGTIGALPALGRTGPGMTILTRGLDLEAAARLGESCAGAVVREFYRFPVATLEEEPGGGRAMVVRDARYTRKGRGFAVYVAPLDAHGVPVVDRQECP